jgi:hypothetical protein
VIDRNNAYFVWGTTSSSSVVEYRSGTLRFLVTWPWSIVANGPRPIELAPPMAELVPTVL